MLQKRMLKKPKRSLRTPRHSPPTCQCMSLWAFSDSLRMLVLLFRVFLWTSLLTSALWDITSWTNQLMTNCHLWRLGFLRVCATIRCKKWLLQFPTLYTCDLSGLHQNLLQQLPNYFACIYDLSVGSSVVKTVSGSGMMLLQLTQWISTNQLTSFAWTPIVQYGFLLIHAYTSKSTWTHLANVFPVCSMNTMQIHGH